VAYSPRPSGILLSPSPIAVVQSVSTSDGLGSTVKLNYSFSGGLYDGSPWDKREFLGFKSATVTNSVGSKTVTTFRQNEGAVNEFNIFKGQVEKVETFDSTGLPLTTSLSIRWLIPSNGPVSILPMFPVQTPTPSQHPLAFSLLGI
jgi:hypothetical protein